MKNLTITDVRVDPGDSAFLIDDSHTAILYDSGFGFTGFGVAENIKKILGDRSLDYIFLTHSHYDHALGSAYVLKYWPNARVVAGKYAAYIFTRPGAKATMKDLDRKYADKCGAGEYEFLGDDLRVDIAVSDGDVVEAGDMRFRVIELPGHTKCSVGYYEEESGLLLSSETLGVYDGESMIIPSFLVGYQMTLDSIAKIDGLKIKKLLAPHFGILSEEQTAFFLKNMRASAEDTALFVVQRLKNGVSKAELIAEIKEKFRRGYIRKIYPEDAVNLNTSIMIDLVEKELLS